MSDVADGATAPAESISAPEVQTPNPVSTEAEGHPAPDAKPEGKPDKAEAKTESAKPISAREALQKAAAKVEKDSKEAEAKPEAKAETKPEAKDTKPVKSEPNRDETGKFAAKEGDKPEVKPEAKPAEQPKPSHTAGEAPARFTKDVKDIWATLPDNVRGEVSRMERELTQGYEKHRTAAERDASLNEYHEMAQRHGTTVKDALANYVGIENLIRQNPIQGLERVCQNMGISLRDIAAHVLNQKPEEVASQQDATIRELRAELADIKKQVGGVQQTFQQQRETAVSKEVTEFRAAHPRFDELADDIAFFLKTRTQDLKEAYELAERLNPAPAKAPDTKPEASSAPVIDLSAQTEKGSKSISGAPTPGSDPAKRKPSNSIKESLRRAMAQAG